MKGYTVVLSGFGKLFDTFNMLGCDIWKVSMTTGPSFNSMTMTFSDDDEEDLAADTTKGSKSAKQARYFIIIGYSLG
jgi:hypothetical protein